MDTLFRCKRCGGRRDFYMFKRKPTVRWVCYGCRLKANCDIPPDDPDDCWIWRGATRGDYGVMFVLLPGGVGKRVMRNAHRIAYMLWRGRVPLSWSVLHHCEEHLCCNPAHLYLKQQPLDLDFVQIPDDTFLR